MYTIDLIIIGIFLVVALAIGLYYSKGITTFKDYAVGSRKMSTFVISTSLIATIYGGGFLRSKLNGYYHQGLYMLLIDLISPVRFYLASQLIIVRMKEFIGDFSIAESMGKVYGPVVRIITAILGMIATIAKLATQFKIGLTILTVTPLFKLVSYPTCWTVILSLLIIVYTTFGGARSVALTDVYQFFLFGVCFPILTFSFIYHAQNPWENWQNFISISQFNISHISTAWNHSLNHIMLYFIWNAIFTFDPAHVQRIYMSSSIQQAAKVFSRSSIMHMILSLAFLITIAALYIGGHNVPPGQSILDYIINLTLFPGIQGLLITSIIALLMSTADSSLHTSSILFANDLWPFIANVIKLNSKPSLKVIRIISGLIGIAAIFIVLHTDSVIQLMAKAFHFYVPVVTVPFMMACFGFRPRSYAVLCSISISIVLTTYRIFIQKQVIGDRDIFMALIYSALVLFIAHYLLPKQPNTGWLGIPDASPVILQNQETKRWWIRKIKYFQSIFTKSYWSDLFPKSVTTFIASGIYFIIYSSILLCYVKQVYGFSYIYWHIAVMAIGTIVTIYPALHTYKQGGNRLLHALWPILLYAVLFIAGITYIKLSHFSPMSCALLIVNIGLTSLLLPYTIIIAMVATALFFHRWIPPHVAIASCKEEWITTETMIGLTILLGCLVYRYLRNKNYIQLQTIALTRTYEQQYALASLHNQANWNRLDPTYSGKVLQDMADELGPYVENPFIQQHQKKLYVFRQSLLKRAKEERTYTLDSKSIHNVSIEDLVLKSYEMVRKLDVPIQLLLTKQTKEKYLLTEPIIFERLLTINFLNLCQGKYTIDHTVSLTISDTLLSYPFPRPYQVAIHSTHEKQLRAPILPALAFSISTDTDRPNISPAYAVTDEIDSCCLPKTINNLYQEESKQIVQAHGGYIETIDTETSLTCLYILPINGKKVMRFKPYHTDDLLNKIAETDESLAQEQELVSLLTSTTTLTEKTVKETIQFI
ncbi:MAG: sodium:solute symporter family protein [Candidatus Cardinium sp.]|uniref:sodium:solute symporter family protein n=1 Tax=Cardinium endosymbiont of Dermatophagoides farinae TaxID=2597823 RepID=UPI0011834B95|nr:sodium:solute symporter family protein [Cardinium endosymbiont of Dermatophagoides farinae]TSJ81268.1 sodium:solute symporter family protein [Cardinium endosymbiont of Dermatophagoides farinae]UWW97326.1 MAG: sodium:solute symporter family protein [Candidatus Cardinium sp.]